MQTPALSNRSVRLPTCVAIAVFRIGLSHGAFGAEVASDQDLTPSTRAAVARGLAWLARQQQDDGSWGRTVQYQRNVAVTSLCGLAFLGAGHVPDRDRYGTVVRQALDSVLGNVQPGGYIKAEQDRSRGPMYGHGFATLFLAEVYGMSPRPDLRTKLKKAVQLIVNSQNAEGGWRYEPVPRDADVSVTVCQLMALRAARNAGIYVPAATVDRSVQYVRSCQNEDGGFRYQLTSRPESQFARSAAALVAFSSAGVYEGSEIDRGLAYLERFLPLNSDARQEAHFYYAHYYAVQVMWFAGGKHWTQWYPAIRDLLLSRQNPDGAWAEPSVCNEYGTAMTCLVLQMPESHLPIFRK